MGIRSSFLLVYSKILKIYCLQNYRRTDDLSAPSEIHLLPGNNLRHTASLTIFARIIELPSPGRHEKPNGHEETNHQAGWRNIQPDRQIHSPHIHWPDHGRWRRSGHARAPEKPAVKGPLVRTRRSHHEKRNDPWGFSANITPSWWEWANFTVNENHAVKDAPWSRCFPKENTRQLVKYSGFR